MPNSAPEPISEPAGRHFSGELCARHWATRQPVCLRWSEGILTAFDPVPRPPPSDLWLAPPLVDLQINGYAGVDFQQDGLTRDELLYAARQLRADGCTRWLLTLITDPWENMMARLRHFRELRSPSDELRQAIVGWHIEGPFLSAEPGFCGAHDPACMCDPTPAHLDELRDAAGTLYAEATGKYMPLPAEVRKALLADFVGDLSALPGAATGAEAGPDLSVSRG